MSKEWQKNKQMGSDGCNERKIKSKKKKKVGTSKNITQRPRPGRDKPRQANADSTTETKVIA